MKGAIELSAEEVSGLHSTSLWRFLARKILDRLSDAEHGRFCIG